MELEILRRTAAEVAAAAVYELYPEVDLLGGEVTPTGFVYEFCFSHPIHIHVIEEKMRQIVQDRRPIRTLEMVPLSASELLKSQGLFSRAEAISEEEGLVEVVQIGSFHDFCPGPHLKNTAQLVAFKIKAESLGEGRLRIEGWCHHSKPELKTFLKQVECYVPPQRIGETLGFWRGDVWFAKGLQLREKLLHFLKKEWFVGVFEVAGAVPGLHSQYGQKRVGEIWRKGHDETYLQLSFFDSSISSLHLIGKTLTILGFDHSISLSGCVTEFIVVDGLGVNRTLVRLEEKKDGHVVLACVERILDQILEKNLWVKLENQ